MPSSQLPALDITDPVLGLLQATGETVDRLETELARARRLRDDAIRQATARRWGSLRKIGHAARVDHAHVLRVGRSRPRQRDELDRIIDMASASATNIEPLADGPTVLTQSERQRFRSIGDDLARADGLRREAEQDALGPVGVVSVLREAWHAARAATQGLYELAEDVERRA
jgi:hypothetical protein